LLLDRFPPEEKFHFDPGGMVSESFAHVPDFTDWLLGCLNRFGSLR
jgi:hypothetical protein